MKKLLLFCTLITLFTACSKTETINNSGPDDILLLDKYFREPENLNDYHVILPTYLKKVGMTDPQVSNDKAALGRVLFYDQKLSRDGKIACANCHKPEKAFSDNVAFSNGIEYRQTTRNSPPLGNVASFSSHYSAIDGKQPLLFWDERASTVSEQAKQTFANEHEMGLTMPQVVEKIKEQEYYTVLWKQVYGNTDVQEDQVLECLSNFVGSFSACNSKFDQEMEKAAGHIDDISITVHNTYSTAKLDGFSPEEFNGLKLFVENCSKCHSPVRPFQEVFMACNGLDMQYVDQGLGARTGNAADNGLFKAPSLRNILLTAPYMHDGRFKTLREVIDFYSTNVKDNPNLHAEMRKNGSIQKNFTAAQKNDLIAFLSTLTDIPSVNNNKFSNPFK